MDRPPVERLDSLKELTKYEDQVLDVIARTPHGALLFLSDPGRFLSEAGFVVGKGLQADLDDLPGKKNSPGRYEDIRAGKGRAATWRVQRFVDFCTSDVARYQLLFQHLLPGFVPSPQAYAPAVRALEMTRETLARNGVGDRAHWDIWTALMTGLVDQQIANDPGGDRWSRLVDEAVAMFLSHCARAEPAATPDRSDRSQPNNRSSHA